MRTTAMEDQNTKPRREDVCPSKKGKLDLDAARARLAETSGPEYWRSLEELAGSPDFQEMLHREFPKGASEWLDAVSRRGFLKLMGASLAMAGMTACTKQPLEPIVPYVKQPEEVVPGRPLFYATAFTLGGYASPVLVESQMFRPTKIEGNDKHPASLGGTDVFSQASILGMYDPDRSQTVTYLGEIRSWSSLVQAMRSPLSIQKSLDGAGIRILTPTISSPTLADQLKSFIKANPQAKWHVYEPANRDNVLEGAKLAFGQPVETHYDLKSRRSRFARRRLPLRRLPRLRPLRARFRQAPNPEAGEMSRLYVAESTPSSTGAKADHRLPLRAAEVESFVRALDMLLGDDTDESMVRPEQEKFLDAGEGPEGHRGSSVVIAGDHQPAAVHAFVHRINQSLGNVGNTVVYTDPVNANPVNQGESLKDLVADMRAAKVDVLVIMGGNPAYDAPTDFGFADAMKSPSVPFRVYLGLYQNETSELCQWHVNEAHYLEAWGDTRAYDGTVSIVQPLIAPLYDGKSAYELVSMLSGQADTKGHEIVQAYWKTQHSGADFDAFWRKSLHDGWVEGTAFAPKQVSAKASAFPPHRPPIPKPSKSTSAAIPPSTTDNSPTTAGCRNCPSR